MSAAEDDTELRDLLIQNLENNGVLNKLKAEMRAAVFLAMEEQDKVENKTLINEDLKKCLNTRDGRLVASLIVDFLQVFNLDLTLAVFQPEINSLNGLDGRDVVCRDLDLSESEVNRKCPLLLELLRRGRHRQQASVCTEDPSHRQITNARRTFDSYDKDRSGSVSKEDLKSVFTDLFPGLNKNMLERFLSDELRTAERSFISHTVDFQLFLGIYRRLFTQCRSVVLQEVSEQRSDSPPLSKDSEDVASLGRGDFLQPNRERLDLDLEEEDDLDDGDSFFDDPLPKPQKTYGWKAEASGARGSPAGSLSEALTPGGGGGASEQSHSRNNVASNSRESKVVNDRTGSLHLDEDVEYDDDFNSHRSDVSRSELSIGEEIEGPDSSDKLDETTQDLSVSQLSLSHGADYMEEVA
ncbi:FGFR1 oncogene partner isoform X2 [Scophthalmus maximus]|uniref:FGFR1 oncogene partner isoform X2 n=1 Tax=Scophthalmus maximus TaxID=52904 RepID=UPI001FA8C2EF|nr:FGFR1 oncogene partner isoform X2 [Scophthalmus maximus]